MVAPFGRRMLAPDAGAPLAPDVGALLTTDAGGGAFARADTFGGNPGDAITKPATFGIGRDIPEQYPQ